MENKGLNVFNTAYVLGKPEMSTDTDLEGILGVIGHEYFHNWTGNRITCRDWFQLTLKEGLTVFRDQTFTEDETSAVKRIDDVRVLRAAQWPEDAGPMAHPIRPESVVVQDNFYTATVYNKGAEVIRMYRTLMGTEAFHRGMDLYFDRHDGDAVTCDDFREAMADAAAGADAQGGTATPSVAELLGGQFERWYEQDGTPTVEIDVVHTQEGKLVGYGYGWDHPDGEEWGTLRLTLTQSTPPSASQPTKEPFVVPIKFALLHPRTGARIELKRAGDDDGSTAVLHGDTLLLTEQTQTLALARVPIGAKISALRGFSAPVKLVVSPQPRDDLAFLMAHDDDPFNRNDAAQRLAGSVVVDLAEQLAGAGTAAAASADDGLDAGFVDAFRQLLNDQTADPALRAASLVLPVYQELQTSFAEIDPDAICDARRSVKQRLAATLRADLLAQLERSRAACSGEYEFAPAQMGHRRLAAVCLDYLVSVDPTDPGVAALCKEAFAGADNMTDQSSALACLAGMDVPEAAEALAAFERQWRDNALVMDKWFGVQVRSPLPGAVGRATALMEHAAFTFTNPNKLRAVVGAFARGNPQQFHDVDGSGCKSPPSALFFDRSGFPLPLPRAHLFRHLCCWLTFGRPCGIPLRSLTLPVDRFLGDVVRRIDPVNPQMGAALAKIFLDWTRYDAPRRALIKAELESILSNEGCSPNTREVVSTALSAEPAAATPSKL